MSNKVAYLHLPDTRQVLPLLNIKTGATGALVDWNPSSDMCWRCQPRVFHLEELLAWKVEPAGFKEGARSGKYSGSTGVRDSRR